MCEAILLAIELAKSKGCNYLEVHTSAPGEWRVTLKFNNRSIKRSIKISAAYVAYCSEQGLPITVAW